VLKGRLIIDLDEDIKKDSSHCAGGDITAGSD
jgi:hypothetical protein